MKEKTMTNRNAAQYSKFKKERTLPAIDPANAIDCKNVHKILDIGCGTGNSTAVLINKFPGADVTGADNSDDMLAVQIPQQYKHPVHKILNSLADSDKWNKKIKEKRTYNNLTEGEYFDILSGLSENFRI